MAQLQCTDVAYNRGANRQAEGAAASACGGASPPAVGARGGSPSSLVIYTKFAAVSGPVADEELLAAAELLEREEARRSRWLALYDVRDALRDQVDDKGRRFRTPDCLRYLRESSYNSETGDTESPNHVEVMRDEVRQKARYGRQLTVCGSVWSCPICSANIAEGRATQLTRALASARALGYTVLMITRTVGHKAAWSLQWQLERFLEAERSMTSQWGYKALTASVGCVGSLKVLEVTWGAENGWHVHTHSLMFLSRPPADLEVLRGDLFAYWRAAAGVQRFATSYDRFTVQATYGAVEDYVGKWGREPIRKPWGVSDEIARGHVKLGRRPGRYSPFALATDYPEKFLEYARAFKGRRQLRWSPGLLALLLPSEPDISDFTLASEPSADYQPWALLTREELAAIDYSRLHQDILEVAGRGDREAFRKIVQGLYSRYAWLSWGHDVGGSVAPAVAPVDQGGGFQWL